MADVQPPATTPWRRLAGGVSTAWSWLGGAETALDAAISVIRSLVVSLAMIAGVVVAVGVVVMELQQRILVPDPYTPQTVARQLKQKIREIRDESTTLMELQGLQGDWEQLDIQIPETETTLRQVLNHLRVLLDRPETRIGDAIVGADEIGYTFRLWSDGPLGAVEVDRERVGEPVLKYLMPVLIAEGAEAIMGAPNPTSWTWHGSPESCGRRRATAGPARRPRGQRPPTAPGSPGSRRCSRRASSVCPGTRCRGCTICWACSATARVSTPRRSWRMTRRSRPRPGSRSPITTAG